MRLRVYYEDTDLGGVVYHSNYLKFCERARSELFFSVGKSPIIDKDGHFVVKHLEADYIGAAVFGDELEVKSKLLKMNRASLVLNQIIWRDSEKIFDMDITLAYIKARKVGRIDVKLMELLQKLFS